MTKTNCTTTEAHCEQCGSTDYEDVHCGDQGYSACCNELVVDSRDCRGGHVADAIYQARVNELVAEAGHASRRDMIDAIGLDAWDERLDAIRKEVY